MGIMPYIMSLQATNLMYSGATGMFGAMDAEMALANSATGMESNSQMMSLGQMDKALALQGAQARMNYEVGQAMMESAQALRKKDNELKENLMKNGAVFV